MDFISPANYFDCLDYMENEKAKLLAAEYVRSISSGLEYLNWAKEITQAFEAGWKACERKDLPYDAMTEEQDAK